MKVVLVVHTKKPNIKKIVVDLIEKLEELDCQIALVEEDALALDIPKYSAKIEGLTQDARLIISIGGDGTILRAIRYLMGRNIDTLGVNLGKLGFMTEILATEIVAALDRYLAGDYEADRRMLIKVKGFDLNGVIFEQDVLNEVVIGRGSQHRLVEMAVSINGRHFTDYNADSVIFSTPTGSTAYALSAGGPLISPTVESILMTPVCPHSFFNRSLLLSPADRIRVDLKRNGQDFTLTLDGITADLAALSSIEIERSKGFINLVRFGKRDFFETVKANLNNWTKIGDE